MSKQTIRTNLHLNWVYALDGCTIQEAIQKLSKFESSAVLEYDYDGYGELYASRLETDEEYAARLKKEAEQEAALERKKIEDARRLLETAEEKIRIAKATNTALHAYLEKHKDNPNLSVLEHMFLTVADLEGAGRHICAKEIRDLMVELEIK